MNIALIAAASENDVIGRNGELPWHLSDDLRRFKQITTGRVIIMGRKTFESVGKPLPDRVNIIVTRQASFQADGVQVCTNLDEALDFARSVCGGSHRDDDVFIVGGESMYRAAMPLAHRIYLTRVHAMIEGDTHFPRLDDTWTLTAHEHRPADDRHTLARSFQIWERAVVNRPPARFES
jgi:dihydrofolate reductase